MLIILALSSDVVDDDMRGDFHTLLARRLQIRRRRVLDRYVARLSPPPSRRLEHHLRHLLIRNASRTYMLVVQSSLIEGRRKFDIHIRMHVFVLSYFDTSTPRRTKAQERKLPRRGFTLQNRRHAK